MSSSDVSAAPTQGGARVPAEPFAPSAEPADSQRSTQASGLTSSGLSAHDLFSKSGAHFSGSGTVLLASLAFGIVFLLQNQKPL